VTARDSTKFPEFSLDPQHLKGDAFGIRESIELIHNYQTQSNRRSDLNEFYNEISRLKKQFASLYGGENAARYLIHSGVKTFHPSGDNNHFNSERISDAYNMRDIPPGLKYTAYRIFSAREQNRPFKIAFGGYSVTVGRGNYFHQSYPFMLKNLLTRPMELLGVELQVRNAAIGGVPSFPYGWCLDNFMGDDADVISWDYSMNEAGGVADGLEAYMRHGLSMKRRPMLIVKDTSIHFARDRYDLVQSYVDNGALKDPIVLSMEDAIESFLHLKEDLLPIGFQEWRKFGAPKGSPGQTSHHPGVKQHESYGWLLTMHFIAVLELVAVFASKDGIANAFSPTDAKEDSNMMLPAPIHGNNVAPKLFSLFYGYDTKHALASKQMSWKMNQVHCRTTYAPILNNNLQDIVVSGIVGDDRDIMRPRGAQLYNKGWVLDLGESEKNAKKKLERYGGLGYIDSKKAYYGIYASGQLELFLPCIGRDDILKKMQTSAEETPARECFHNVVVCEVNEKHTGKECNLEKDLSFLMGDFKSEEIELINAVGPSYWGRNICLRIGIPSESKLSKAEEKLNGDSNIGVSLTITVASTSVILRSGPCSISHVVWEQMDKIEL